MAVLLLRQEGGFWRRIDVLKTSDNGICATNECRSSTKQETVWEVWNYVPRNGLFSGRMKSIFKFTTITVD
jgi:hypothetical protein